MTEGETRIGQPSGLHQFGFGAAELLKRGLQRRVSEERDLYCILHRQRPPQELRNLPIGFRPLGGRAGPADLFADPFLGGASDRAEAAVAGELRAARERERREAENPAGRYVSRQGYVFRQDVHDRPRCRGRTMPPTAITSSWCRRSAMRLAPVGQGRGRGGRSRRCGTRDGGGQIDGDAISELAAGGRVQRGGGDAAAAEQQSLPLPG